MASDKHDKQKQAILESLKNGATRHSAASAAGIARATFYRWIQQDADFAEQVEVAECAAIAAVENALFKRALDPDASPSAAIFYLKCRAKWRENDNNGANEVSNLLRSILQRGRETGDSPPAPESKETA